MIHISNRYSSVKDEANIVINEFDRAYAAKSSSYERGLKAWRRYFPINHGKWSEEALKTLKEEMRHPVQFDIAGPKVDTLAGSLVADLPDPTWVPVVGQPSRLTEAIAKKYYIDKDLFNYDDVLLKVFRDGLVHSGDLEITEDYDMCGSPHIKFGRVMFGFLLWDPYWETDDDRDAECAYRISYMNAERLMRKYDFASDELKAEYRAYKMNGAQVEPDMFTTKQSQVYSKVGDEFQVIEKHYIKTINKKRLVGRVSGTEEFIPFPVVDGMKQSDGEAYLSAFADMNRIDWTSVNESKYFDKVHYVTTVCRQLRGAEIQIEKKSKIQPGGLPYYHFTTMRVGGEDMGIPESMEGFEDTINKRESLITELISKANGGSQLVNRNLFDGKPQFDRWMNKKNKPGHSELVDLDAVKTPFVNIAANQYPSAIVDQINRMYDRVLPIVSRVSDALSSISDSSTSGILFERQFQTNMIANTLMNRGMRQFINNVAEGYFNQFQLTYGDLEHKVPMGDGKGDITLNKRMNGRILNDVKSIPRCRVVIAENKKSQTYQMRWRSIWAEMLTSLKGMEQIVPGHIALILKNFFETIDMKDEDKEEVKLLNEMVMVSARLSMVSQITGNQAQAQNNTLMGAQAEVQMQQVMQMMNSMYQQEAPIQQHYQDQTTAEIQYPSEGDNMNLSPIEAAAGGAQIPPAETGAFT